MMAKLNMRTKYNMKRSSFILLFLTPSLILFLLFILYPNILSFYYALLKWDGISKIKEFVGLKNFIDILHDNQFYNALVNNLIYLVIIPVVTFGISMFFAVVLTQREYFETKFYKVIFYFPNILSVSLIGMIWVFIYSPRNGILNNVLSFIGFKSMENFAWLGNPDVALLALAFPKIWVGVGFYMIIMMATIKGIPITLYEAADIDGASKFQQVFKITIPLVWDMIQVSLIYAVITVFSGFQLIMVTTGGGPLGSTELLGSYMINFIMRNTISSISGGEFYPQFGYAAAIGIVTFFISLAFVFIMTKLMKKDSIQY